MHINIKPPADLNNYVFFSLELTTSKPVLCTTVFREQTQWMLSEMVDIIILYLIEMCALIS